MMGVIKTNYGEPSYSLESKKISVFVTIKGGHLTATFKHNGKGFEPFFVPPWWDEARTPGSIPLVDVLRGDFFCLPFGANEEKFNDRKYLVHGSTANENWLMLEYEDASDEKKIKLSVELDHEEGMVEKIIRINDSDPVIYCKNRITGYKGKVPLGNHPTLSFPDLEGVGIIDISEPVIGYSAPDLIENPETGGYSHIRPNTKIENRKKFPTIEGSTIDLSRFPTPKGFDDIHMFVCDQSRDFCFSSVTVQSEGYLYFQIKDPRVLRCTLLWTANRGRHFKPWDGRTTCLGLEEITGFFHYGIKNSVEENFISKKGTNTFLELDKKPFDVNIIMGLVPVSKNFTGVKDIVKKDGKNITIIGKDNQRIDVPCSIDFLSKSQD